MGRDGSHAQPRFGESHCLQPRRPPNKRHGREGAKVCSIQNLNGNAALSNSACGPLVMHTEHVPPKLPKKAFAPQQSGKTLSTSNAPRHSRCARRCSLLRTPGLRHEQERAACEGRSGGTNVEHHSAKRTVMVLTLGCRFQQRTSSALESKAYASCSSSSSSSSTSP